MFVFDPEKSAANQRKHGIDFVAAQALWAEPRRQAVIPARPGLDGEARYLVIGRIAEKHWTAIITLRGDAIRIISVRRARTEEVALYERKYHH
jgi:uncharacterized protein